MIDHAHLVLHSDHGKRLLRDLRHGHVIDNVLSDVVVLVNDLRRFRLVAVQGVLASRPQFLALNVQMCDCFGVRGIQLEKVFSAFCEALDLRVSRDEHGSFVALAGDDHPGNVVGHRITSESLLELSLLVLPILETLNITNDKLL